MSKPPRPGSATSFSVSQQRHVKRDDLISTSDGYAQVSADGEIHVGKTSNSVVFRKRTKSAQPLGRTTPTCPDGRYTTLPKDFVFGVPNKQDKEHAGTILHEWKAHAPPSTKLQYDFGRDFISLNRGSVADRCHTPSHVRWYRESHDARVGSKKLERPGFTATSQPAKDASTMTPAGVSSTVAAIPELRFANAIGSASTTGRDSDMSSLVAHEYRYAWVAQKITEHEDVVRKQKRSATPDALHFSAGAQIGPTGRVVSHYPRTVADRVSNARSRYGQDRVHPKEYFNMRQFKDVPSRVFTPTQRGYSLPRDRQPSN